MNTYKITYYKNDEKISCEQTVAVNIFTASMYADETCKKMYKIEGGKWTFSINYVFEEE